jgi:hypothetical protein
LKELFEGHLLQLLEVLGIVGDLLRAVYTIHDVMAWLADVSVSLFVDVDVRTYAG